MDKLVTTSEAAAALGVSTRTIRRYVTDGLLKPIILPSGHYRFNLNLLLAAPSETESNES